MGRCIRISLSEQVKSDYMNVCYDDSLMLKRLAWYPFIQLGVVMIFVVVAIFALLTSKRAEQNKVWVGLSKETAHQLGTPISSLMAWQEILKESYPESLNASLFEWVIENLCKNAVDAMGGGQGTITLHVEETETKAILDVTDTGKGIRKKDIGNVFRPGFTTKKRGWGLGLSLAKRIVEEYHHGRIYVRSSEVGKGTTFRIERCATSPPSRPKEPHYGPHGVKKYHFLTANC